MDARRYTLHDVAIAHEHLEQRRQVGKALLVPQACA
jgi:hypothetical protein